ncbi:hypothetical protein ACFYRN_23240 [Streptomyces sp. NPDC005227]|uniref:hypothetical protein n=1 Tax=Streptomyces sp. NPDC005227 TaxID=3364707 RepID=UPI0036A5C0B0
MPNQAPSLGRIVLVPADPAVNNGATVAPAIITRVFSDDVINVRVLLDSDALQHRTSVTRVDDLLNEGHPHCWSWPPRV